MKNTLLKSVVICVCLLSFVCAATAQKRKPTRKRTVRPTAVNVFEIKNGAAQVSTQIKNVSKFLFGLGGVARVIEDLDRDIAARKASRNASSLNTKNKQAVVTTIRNLRAGLAALEIEFRTKPALKNYVFQINGISEMAGKAEDQAADGQITESGKTLLLVVEKLADTLAALP